MVHGQDYRYWSFPFSEHCYWKVIQAFSFVKDVFCILPFCTMSRCFPFPPPGYEKKARNDNPDLLKKEKQSEKKHKKEKKDKEKRENKGKKDKDGRDEKHKDKKDKKEKHREKKKDKDRDKDKEKNRSSDEKKPSGKSESHDGEKKLPGHNGEKFVPKEKEKDRDRNSNSGEKKVPMQFSGYSGEHSQNIDLAGDSKDSKFVQELESRVGDEGIGDHMAKKFSTERRRDDGIVKLVARSTCSFDEGKKKKDERGVGDESRFSGNVMVQNLAVQKRVEGTSRLLEKDSENRTEVKERTRQKEGDDKIGDKSKYSNREKNKQAKEKEKEKEEKEKMKSEHKNIKKDKLKQITKDDHIATHDMKTIHLPKDGDKNAISEANLRKRKDLETNGFCHANDIKPSKLPRPTSSLQLLTEGNKLPKSALLPPLMEINKLPRPISSPHSLPRTGGILEPYQNPALCTSDKGGAADNLKADNKEGKLNGVISQPLSISAARPQLTAVQTDQISEVSMKPSHPDTKYLSRVLLVPKMEYCSNFDDQEEWLFHSSDSHSKISKLGSSGNDELPQVWAEAMRIESADVCALPYVIPY